MSASRGFRYNVRATVDPRYGRAVSGLRLRRWAEAVLAGLDVPPGAGLDVGLTDDDAVRSLNREYRGLDEATDVLSFPFQDMAAPASFHGEGTAPGEGAQPFVVPPSEAGFLGEVVIAFPYARHQAAAAGHPVQDEIPLLLVHGILHLLGHDHAEPEEERRMWEETHRLLRLLHPPATGNV